MQHAPQKHSTGQMSIGPRQQLHVQYSTFTSTKLSKRGALRRQEAIYSKCADAQAPSPHGGHPQRSILFNLTPVLQLPAYYAQAFRIANFRFWHDEKRFRSSGDLSLAQIVLFAAGGIRAGGNLKAAPTQGAMGWQVPDRWDILWSTSDGNMKAANFVKPGQLISALPGLDCITKKQKLPVTLHTAYGSAAWQMLPRTYSIPAQIEMWQQCLVKQLGPAGTAPSAISGAATAVDYAAPDHWVLKTGEHLGRGLAVVPGNKALSALVERNRPPAGLRSAQTVTTSPSPKNTDISAPTDDATGSSTTPETSTVRPYLCAQQYVTNPMLIDGRKFGVRLWVLVLGPAPFRAYIHSTGLVLFSGQQYNPDLRQVAAAGLQNQGHLTNHAQDDSAEVWPLHKLMDLLGPEESHQLWAKFSRTAGCVVAAAVGHVKSAAKQRKLPQDCAFELLGLDYLVDDQLQPWLLEVNASPSLGWHHKDPATAKLMRNMKLRLMCDTVSLLRLKDRYSALPCRQHPHKHNEDSNDLIQQAVPTGSAAAETADKHNVHRDSSFGKASFEPEQNLHMNQLIIKAASAHYFQKRPDMVQLVKQAAQHLQEAHTAAPKQEQVQRDVQQLLQKLQHRVEQSSEPGAQTPAVGDGGSLVGGKPVARPDIEREVIELLQGHADVLARVEAEMQVAGNWQSLTNCMHAVLPESTSDSIDTALKHYWRLRAGNSNLLNDNSVPDAML